MGGEHTGRTVAAISGMRDLGWKLGKTTASLTTIGREDEAGMGIGCSSFPLLPMGTGNDGPGATTLGFIVATLPNKVSDAVHRGLAYAWNSIARATRCRAGFVDGFGGGGFVSR